MINLMVILRIAITLAACALVWLLAGCASTTITFERPLDDGRIVKGSYHSTKNLTVTIATNGTLTVIASASEATDANTRLVKQVTASVLEAAALAK